jgi:hypothetical protein
MNKKGMTRPTNYWQYEIWGDGVYTWETTPDLRRADINWVEMGPEVTEILTSRPDSPEFGQPLAKIRCTDTLMNWFSWPIHKIYIPTPNFQQPRGGQSDMYIFRLAETCLLRAEAAYWKGDLNAAAADINAVRKRAHAPAISSEDVTIDYIFDERARELFTEVPRHSEMVRVSYIMARQNLNGYSLDNFSSKNWFYDRVMKVNSFYSPDPVTGEPQSYMGRIMAMNPHHVLWPVPQSAITGNTMGTINQNEGYFGAENNVSPLTVIE